MSEVIIKSYAVERELQITANLKKGLEKVGQIVERQAKQNVTQAGSGHPQVQTGRLRSSINHSVSGETAVIGTNVNYGTFLEFGTSHHPPYPWLFPAVESKRGDIIDALKGGNI